MGITDDRSRAMRAGEESLGSGQAVVVIIEAVRPAMAPQTLAPCYARTGMGWLGWCTYTGEVSWDRFFAPVDRAASAARPGEPLKCSSGGMQLSGVERPRRWRWVPWWVRAPWCAWCVKIVVDQVTADGSGSMSPCTSSTWTDATSTR
jgi:hypothetical protein